MKYMLLMASTSSEWEGSMSGLSHDELMAHIRFMHGVNARLTETGELVDAVGLSAPDEARIVRADSAGAALVTDGPFPESKEFLAGFWVIECAGIERACEIAAHISTAPGAGGAPMNFPVEVRPIGEAPDSDEVPANSD